MELQSLSGHCKGSLKLIGCIVERLVPSTSPEFQLPASSEHSRKGPARPATLPPCHHGN